MGRCELVDGERGGRELVRGLVERRFVERRFMERQVVEWGVLERQVVERQVVERHVLERRVLGRHVVERRFMVDRNMARAELAVPGGHALSSSISATPPASISILCPGRDSSITACRSVR